MGTVELHSPVFRVLYLGTKDHQFYGKLVELRTQNEELFTKIFNVCQRLRFVDKLRHEAIFLIDKNIFGETIGIDSVTQYQLDRLITYLTLTCIDISAGRGHEYFRDWLSKSLKEPLSSWSQNLQLAINELTSIADPYTFGKGVRNWVKVLEQDYLKDFGVKNKFSAFLKTELPNWLVDWVSGVYFIFNGEIKAEKDIADFYKMRSEDKIDLLTKYFYSLRNKYTHTVDYAETHEDGQTRWFRSPNNYGGDNSILTRIIYKEGDQKQKVEWTIGVKSNFAENDIIRLILVFQIRQKLLYIKDGEEFVTEFLNRMNYRVIGYKFIEELEANIKQIQELKLYYLDQSPYFQPPKPIFGVAQIMADTFIPLHNKLYPMERFLIKPAYHEQFPEHQLKLYPGVREVRLDQYLDFVIGINQQIQHLTEKNEAIEKFARSNDLRILVQFMECIIRDLSQRLDKILY